jgi:signal transduction histidine kinase
MISDSHSNLSHDTGPSRPRRELIHCTGAMADRIRSFDWSPTPLGPLHTWSPARIASLNLMLACRFPAVLLFGPEFITSYNDEFVPLMADKHPATLGQPGAQVYAESKELLTQQWTRVLTRGETILQKNVCVPIVRNGTLEDVYWTYSYSPVYETDGTILGVLVVCHDVTEELIARRERDALSERLNHVLEATTDSVMMIDRQWRFTYVNPRAYRVIAPISDVLGKVCWDAFPLMVYPGSPYVEHFYRAMDEQMPGEFEAFYPEPLNVWIRAQVRPAHTGIVVFFRDITDQKKTTDTLIRTEKLAAVGRLAASIAHEINNPLESVTNLLYLAQSSTTVEEAQTYLVTAEQELRRVSAIANQTLRFHKQASRPIPITCDELFSSVLTIYRARIDKANIRIEKMKKCPKPVTCFDGEIRQILSNLIGNAIDAMPPEGGRLLLRSRTGCDWESMRPGMVITIADTGNGIPPDTLKRIFDPFFTTKGFNGTGLGLWVSQEIAQRHRGILRVRSSQGHGTVFTLFLPFEPAVRA